MLDFTLNKDDYRDRVLGCWLGKNIGGTLGAPFEWRRQVNDVSFYTQDLGGQSLPNDDLDIQLLWLVALEEKGIHLDAHTLAEYWCLYVTPHWAEYGTAKTNMRSGLPPPLSGSFRNGFKHSCGAFIRSEIWACIAPGLPDVAARYAYEDAILDHGDGEGTYAEVFCAALESAAFVIPDLRQLIEIGLSYIPEDCAVAGATRCAVECFDKGLDWREARDVILRVWRGSAFFNADWAISREDKEKGFAEGRLGFDAPSNIALTVLGLLHGGEDFGQIVCTAVNCGEDTDCTAATAGAIFGLIHGAKGIPEAWITPIGRGIKVGSLNLGELGYYGDQLPQTVDELTDRTERIARQVTAQGRWSRVVLSDSAPTDLSGLGADGLRSSNSGADLFGSPHGPTYRFDWFRVGVDYGDAPAVRSGEPKTVRLTLHNDYKVQANISVHWDVPPGWQVAPSADGVVQSLPPHLAGGRPVTMEFTLHPGPLARSMNRATVELTIEGRPTVMLVPITLLNGDLMPAA
ncbi:MAG: ADP-ribosylglycohydrolase family protein [Armatimonadetes bacterium]|nr:ADP-ribosylglycohydrolase family protein [Armatimonadota bacterium]